MNATPPDKDSLIEYPCDFPIKVMGLKVEGYQEAMSHVVRQFDPDWTEDRLETRESAGGKYLSLTFTVRATSREQLDELYRTLSTHPMVRVVL
jgi:putative lipoic acid-binding regulatory protein